MRFMIEGLDDFIALSQAYSSYMRLFYHQEDNLTAYGLPATTEHMIVVAQSNGPAAAATLLAAFPSAIQLENPIDIGETIGANGWNDFKTLIDGITDSLNPPQVVYYIQNGNYFFTALDGATGVTFTAADYSHAVVEANIAIAYPSVIKFSQPVSILES